jgi:hypothetical protein
MNNSQDFEAYSYRVQARFGSRVQIHIEDGTFMITGSRISAGVYSFWLAVQKILLPIIVLLFIFSLILWNINYLFAGVVLLIFHGCFGGFGAGCLWELQSLIDFGNNSKGTMLSLPLTDIREIRIGKGWARYGMNLAIAPYIPGINAMAEGLAVSFEAPDPETGKTIVFGLHMRSKEQAAELASALQRVE